MNDAERFAQLSGSCPSVLSDESSAFNRSSEFGHRTSFQPVRRLSLLGKMPLRETVDISTENDGFRVDLIQPSSATVDTDNTTHDDPKDLPLKTARTSTARTSAAAKKFERFSLYDEVEDMELPAKDDVVNESSLGGLRVIFSRFREMNDTVKMEALAVMVNLTLSPNVADSLVFHQEVRSPARLINHFEVLNCALTKRL
jgi:hypothetical protein